MDHEIRINISVEIDDETIYEDWAGNMESFEESCLRKAQHAIDDKLNQLQEEQEDE